MGAARADEAPSPAPGDAHPRRRHARGLHPVRPAAASRAHDGRSRWRRVVAQGPARPPRELAGVRARGPRRVAGGARTRDRRRDLVDQHDRAQPRRRREEGLPASRRPAPASRGDPRTPDGPARGVRRCALAPARHRSRTHRRGRPARRPARRAGRALPSRRGAPAPTAAVRRGARGHGGGGLWSSASGDDDDRRAELQERLQPVERALARRAGSRRSTERPIDEGSFVPWIASWLPPLQPAGSRGWMPEMPNANVPR